MPWGRFDDGYAHNRKIRKLSDQAFRLDVAGILWANAYGTDGFISDDDLELVCAEVRKPGRTAKELEDRRRWERVEGGWRIHHFLDYNPSAEQLRAASELKTLRQQRWRTNRRDASGDGDVDASTVASHNASRDAIADASHDGAPPRAQSPTPTPTPIKNSSSSADADDGTTKPPKRSRTRTPPERFDEFWRVYPRRVGKIHAERAYAKALANGTSPDTLIAGAKFYAMEKKLADPQFVKHPATWLNGGCWQDEPDPAYKPPVIGAPSVAASAQPRPYAEVRAEQAGYSSPLLADQWPELDTGRIPE